jgi:hypothetical protein
VVAYSRYGYSIARYLTAFASHNLVDTVAIRMTPGRITLVAVLGLILGATAQAQQTEGEEAGPDEIRRVEAKMTDMLEQGKDLKLHHATPREVMEFCQETLPKLDDMFRAEMMYAPPELKPEFQADYVMTRQSLLSDLVLAKVALSTPSSGQ